MLLLLLLLSLLLLVEAILEILELPIGGNC
jgi:hypothetical protein